MVLPGAGCGGGPGGGTEPLSGIDTRGVIGNARASGADLVMRRDPPVSLLTPSLAYFAEGRQPLLQKEKVNEAAFVRRGLS